MCFDLIPDSPKGLAPFFSWYQYGNGILDAPMNQTPRMGSESNGSMKWRGCNKME